MAKKGRKKGKRKNGYPNGCAIHVNAPCKEVYKHTNPGHAHNGKKGKGKKGKAQKAAACVMRYAHRVGISLKSAWAKQKQGLICKASKRKKNYQARTWTVMGARGKNKEWVG